MVRHQGARSSVSISFEEDPVTETLFGRLQRLLASLAMLGFVSLLTENRAIADDEAARRGAIGIWSASLACCSRAPPTSAAAATPRRRRAPR